MFYTYQQINYISLVHSSLAPCQPTQRALDLWVRCGFSSIVSVPNIFLPVERVSVPPTSPVTQAVGRFGLFSATVSKSLLIVLGTFFRRPPETTARHRSCQAEPSARLAEAGGDPAHPTRFEAQRQPQVSTA